MGLFDSQRYILASYALVMSVIAAYYYMRVIKLMYFDKPKQKTPIHVNRNTLFSLNINVLLTLIFGLFPASLINLIYPVQAIL